MRTGTARHKVFEHQVTTSSEKYASRGSRLVLFYEVPAMRQNASALKILGREKSQVWREPERAASIQRTLLQEPERIATPGSQGQRVREGGSKAINVNPANGVTLGGISVSVRIRPGTSNSLEAFVLQQQRSKNNLCRDCDNRAQYLPGAGCGIQPNVSSFFGGPVLPPACHQLPQAGPPINQFPGLSFK